MRLHANVKRLARRLPQCILEVPLLSIDPHSHFLQVGYKRHDDDDRHIGIHNRCGCSGIRGSTNSSLSHKESHTNRQTTHASLAAFDTHQAQLLSVTDSLTQTSTNARPEKSKRLPSESLSHIHKSTDVTAVKRNILWSEKVLCGSD